MTDYSSITKFSAFVQLKDFRAPTKKEYVRYVRRLGDHYQCDPATLTGDNMQLASNAEPTDAGQCWIKRGGGGLAFRGGRAERQINPLGG